MTDRKDLNITLPEWYQMELQTQKTMLKLSRVHELEFYLNHPDEYIRHQAILRLGQLRNREALAPLNKIIDDPLEITINREMAAWVLKSTGLMGNDDYFIGNHYLDHYTGNEKLRDFYYPTFTEGRTNPEYHFKSSGIEAMMSEETLLIRAESLEEKADLPFPLNQWFKTWLKMKLEGLRKGSEQIGKKSAAALSGFIQQIIHPEKKTVIKKQKQHQGKLTEEMEIVHTAKPEIHINQNIEKTEFPSSILKAPDELIPEFLNLSVETRPTSDTVSYTTSIPAQAEKAENQPAEMMMDQATNTIHPAHEMNTRHEHTKAETANTESPLVIETRKPSNEQCLTAETKTVPQAKTESPAIELLSPVTETGANAEDSRRKSDTGSVYENKTPVETNPIEFHQAGGENNPDYYIKPFKLKSCPQDKESRKLRVKSKIYVRGNTRELSFSDAAKGIALKLMKIILLPFVILWNQKVVFLTLIVCLYLFFTFIPFGRMLFYRRSPELARMNDQAVKTAQVWINDKVAQLQEVASEYELVRDIQKRMVSETQEQKTVQEPVKYIVTSKTLNLRKAAGTQADKLLVLEQNMIVEFLNQSVDTEAGQTWLYIKAPDGTTGWSFAGYLKKLEGGIEAYEGK